MVAPDDQRTVSADRGEGTEVRHDPDDVVQRRGRSRKLGAVVRERAVRIAAVGRIAPGEQLTVRLSYRSESSAGGRCDELTEVQIVANDDDDARFVSVVEVVVRVRDRWTVSQPSSVWGSTQGR